MTAEHKHVVTINLDVCREAICRTCDKWKTVYPIKFSNGTWSWACKGCAPHAKMVP